MPLMPKKAKSAPAKVDVSAPGASNSREVVLEFPNFKKLTPAEITQLEQEKGEDVLAICDVTGEPIFKAKNINVIQNPDRPELHEKVVCTKVLMKLLEASEKVNGKATKETVKA